MFLGHAALGLAAKRAAPRANLGWLLTAPYLADLLWPVFLLLGWEHVRIAPGNTAVTPLDFTSYPWSHSLLMMIVWGIVLGGIYGGTRRDARGAWMIGALVVSHWVLDWFAHRPDLPLVPWGGPKLGLGLWNSKPATIVVELALFIAGIATYLATTRAKSWAGHVSLWSLLALLAFAYFGNLEGPPPPSEHAIGLFGLVGLVFIPWAMWIEATRVVRRAPA